MEALAGRDQSQTALQMLTAPRERRIVGGGEVEAHHPEQGVQEPFGLAQREMVEEPQSQGGLDGEIRVPPLPTPPAAPAGCPGSDRLRGPARRIKSRKREWRSRSVAMCELRAPVSKSPSQWPGTARSAASAGRSRGPAWRGSCTPARPRVRRTLPPREKPSGPRQPTPAATATSGQPGRRR